MTQPTVTITELDGALGVLPPSSGALYALVGVSSLQWGRRTNAAEWRCSHRALNSGRWLQWGRRTNAAE